MISLFDNGTLTVALSGEIDHHCARKFMDGINAKIESYSPGTCVLDFLDVSFMDSSGIAVVINAMRSMKRIHGELIVCGVKPQPMKVFLASGIDKLIPIKEVAS